jgi:hypothetical protein
MKDDNKPRFTHSALKTAPKIQNAFKKIKHALPKTQEEKIDSVQVGIAKRDQYAQKIATGYQILPEKKHQMLKIKPEDLENYKLTYDKEDKILKENLGNIATTIGKKSKGIPDTQAFVMDKEGVVYVGTHKGVFGSDNLNLTHASFLGGKPAEMAGIIGIKKGKITFISDDSGHYAPKPLDMYRGIKKLQKNMPDVFDKDAQIELHSPYHHKIKITDFINNMEIEFDNIPMHEIERQKEKMQLNLKKHFIKNTKSLVISATDLPNSINNLSQEEKTRIKEALINPEKNVNLVIKSSNKQTGKDEFEALKPLQAANLIIQHESNKGEFIKSLLNDGRADIARNILCCAISDGKKDVAKAIFTNSDNVSQILRHDSAQPGPSVLHFAAYKDDVDTLREILQHPDGRVLLNKKDHTGKTALDFAKSFEAKNAAKFLDERLTQVENYKHQGPLKIDDNYIKIKESVVAKPKQDRQTKPKSSSKANFAMKKWMESRRNFGFQR